MILFELVGSEGHPAYQALEVSNGLRQYHFLNSIVEAATQVGRTWLSSHVIKALNFHAITCLHTNAGEYRPCEVEVGQIKPPPSHSVPALMDDFVNDVNRSWDRLDPVVLGAYVLWKLNFIHPFINGNGRSARAACYFVICMRVGKLLPGTTILPELLKRDHDEYVAALRAADNSIKDGGQLDLSALHQLLQRLLNEQMQSAEAPTEGEAPNPETPKA